VFGCLNVFAQTPKPEQLEGRWDLNIEYGGKKAPAWLEVRHSGLSTLVGRVMLMFGSARPIAKINFDQGKFSFSIPPQWDAGKTDLQFEGSLVGDSLQGIIKYVDGKEYRWTGGKAPLLQSNKPPVWGKPLKLFNGKDLQGWRADGENQWVVEDDILKSPKSGANLITTQLFTDFKLHIEFRYPKDGNSGIYLRGRYEVQVSDSKGLQPNDVLFAGVYGLLSANEMVAKSAGEWQSFDITLVGRRVTVIANGVSVITDQVIPGITGGALDSREGEPGPIMLQGDHSAIEYRNIVITPIK
jgi:Domain of Unknown Function (DUF1080)